MTEDMMNSHKWGVGWKDSEKPHPGFGGSQNIYGGYVAQCEICDIYIDDFDESPIPCKEKNNGC